MALFTSSSIDTTQTLVINPNPTDRAKRGSKRQLICDGHGVPLAVRVTGANRKPRKRPVRHILPGSAGDAGAGPPACSATATDVYATHSTGD